MWRMGWMREMDYHNIVHRCFRCGYCKFTSDYSSLNCPSYSSRKFETYFSGGRMWLIRGWSAGEIAWSEHLGEIMYSCTTCRNCVEVCVFEFGDRLVDVIIAARADMVEKGQVPRKVSEFFTNIAKFGNPWGVRPKRWTERTYDGNEFLLHAGCVALVDERANRALKALAEVLEVANIDFGVAAKEICEGNEVLVMGEFGLFEELARRCSESFERMGVKKVITPDPHAYNAFRNYYGNFGKFETFHHTQVLSEVVDGLEIEKLGVRVTYHDPCFLGRWNGVYEEPRKVLSKVATLIEMPRNRKNAFCCGGGSGNFYTDYLAGKESAAKMRVREAAEVADVLVTACPACLIMLESAAKDENAGIEVKDVAELVREALVE